MTDDQKDIFDDVVMKQIKQSSDVCKILVYAVGGSFTINHLCKRFVCIHDDEI